MKRIEDIYIPSFSCIHTNKNFTSIVNKKVLIVYFLNLNEKDTQSKCSKTLQNDVNPEKSIYSTNFIVVEYFPHKVSWTSSKQSTLLSLCWASFKINRSHFVGWRPEKRFWREFVIKLAGSSLLNGRVRKP